MPWRCVSRLVAIWLLFSSIAFGTEPGTTSHPETVTPTADEWSGKMIMAKSPDVVLREQPTDESPPLTYCWTGIWLKVKEAIRDYDLAIELQPRDSWAIGARGFCWTKKGDYDKATL